jgi:hypothetical protein
MAAGKTIIFALFGLWFLRENVVEATNADADGEGCVSIINKIYLLKS